MTLSLVQVKWMQDFPWSSDRLVQFVSGDLLMSVYGWINSPCYFIYPLSYLLPAPSIYHGLVPGQSADTKIFLFKGD